ncbi:Fic family protein (plasmid) [Shimia sp. W99]
MSEVESVSLCEPLMVAEDSALYKPLLELAHEVGTRSAALSASVPEQLRPVFADVMRAANCYYSNLIEGHDTHPISAERALAGNYDAEPEKRDLQLEAVAHIKVQQWIDEGGLEGLHPMALEAILEIHRRFCNGLPPELLIARNPETGEEREIVPGEIRTGYVMVGAHTPPSPEAVPAFMDHMHRRYNVAGKVTGILSSAYSHHRLAWLHPFDDLNGRVTRMVSHAMLLNAAGSAGLWSVSRGLARDSETYKRKLAAADEERRGERDGRGHLSEARLADFATFFLEVCLDQIEFMSDLFEPVKLRQRITEWAERKVADKTLRKGSDRVMRIAALEGTIERGFVPELLGVSDRAARMVTKELEKAGALTSTSPKEPLRLSMNSELALEWMPKLIPPAG